MNSYNRHEKKFLKIKNNITFFSARPWFKTFFCYSLIEWATQLYLSLSLNLYITKVIATLPDYGEKKKTKNLLLLNKLASWSINSNHKVVIELYFPSLFSELHVSLWLAPSISKWPTKVWTLCSFFLFLPPL